VGSIDRAVEIAGRFVEARYSPIEVRLVGRQATGAATADAEAATGASA
jgi:hypothetical protein